jgi:hypothetical protein
MVRIINENTWITLEILDVRVIRSLRIIRSLILGVERSQRIEASLVVLLQQYKKRRESGKICHTRTTVYSEAQKKNSN